MESSANNDLFNATEAWDSVGDQPEKHDRHDSTAFMSYEDRQVIDQLILDGRQSSTKTELIDTAQVQKAKSVPSETDPNSKSFNEAQWVQAATAELRRQGIAPSRISVAFKNLSILGFDPPGVPQDTVWSQIRDSLNVHRQVLSFRKPRARTILHNVDGLVQSGELLLVLGRPGSGCSTLLKTMAGQLRGLQKREGSDICYNGVSQEVMMREFRGETIYTAQADVHFPHLTVGQTLGFATACRVPPTLPAGISRQEHIRRMTQVAMAVTGLTHACDTKVGNAFVKSISSGERKQVSIAETMLSGASLVAWDQSLRGLDAATALKFAQSLRLVADVAGVTHAVATYQAGQAIYDLFDKVTVLYDGHQIYFGSSAKAKAYFEDMGFECLSAQTTTDFLSSVTSSSDRRVRAGMENKTPRTPGEFKACWRKSSAFEELQVTIERHYELHPPDPHTIHSLQSRKTHCQEKGMRSKSCYTTTIYTQVLLATERAFRRMRGDPAASLTHVLIHTAAALILGSAFYNTPRAAEAFFSRASVLFLCIQRALLTAVAEVTDLYDHRPVVEKHFMYAFYHPAAEAMASFLSDLPIRLLTSALFNIIIYFLSNLRREADAFFLFWFVTFLASLVMSALMRALAANTKTMGQAMNPISVLLLVFIVYTGFVIRVPQMHPWFSWLRWLNPLHYAFEVLIANEVHNVRLPCSDIVPNYQPPKGDSWICTAVGSVPGEMSVSGDALIAGNFGYYWSHVGRNCGILVAFLVFFLAANFISAEMNWSTSNGASDIRIFSQSSKRCVAIDELKDANRRDGLSATEAACMKTINEVRKAVPQAKTLSWRSLSHHPGFLDNATGWIKPGSLTAVMGVTGSGKTVFLDALAQRTTTGSVTGDIAVNEKPLSPSYPRKIGYVQQDDLHLATATVRESLRFSATVRQRPTTSKKEKYAFVEELIDLLEMREFADNVVGQQGLGLDTRQLKLLSIGVELAAKPMILLLDEPVAGLDSHSASVIYTLLRRLADAGQVIICTAHQPSATQFQHFNRVLCLGPGGKTLYFGENGVGCRTLIDYFERSGARRCGTMENPAEFLLDVVKRDEGDWNTIWNKSREKEAIDQEVNRLMDDISVPTPVESACDDSSAFALPISQQLPLVMQRLLRHYWRMPGYIFGKFIPGALSALFVGFSFWMPHGSFAGMQEVQFAVLMIVTIFPGLALQLHPTFVALRGLYEIRERLSKAYSWQAFLISSIVVELPFMIFNGVLIFGGWYYAVVGVQSSSRQGLVLLFSIQLLIYTSSFGSMVIAALPSAQVASSVTLLLVFMILTFAGVLQPVSALPRFWHFMYRLSPMTYWISGMVSTQLHNRAVTCSAAETSIFDPPEGMTCVEYLSEYLASSPAVLQNPEDTSACRVCPLSVADEFVAASGIYWNQRWRNFGIVWGFIGVNFMAAFVLFWAFRVHCWRPWLRLAS